MRKNIRTVRLPASISKSPKWEPPLPNLSTKMQNDSPRSTDDNNEAILPVLNLLGNYICSVERIERRRLQENWDIAKTESVAKRRIVIEEPKNDTESFFNDSEISDVERMFEGVCDYEDELLESDHDKYSLNSKVNNGRKGDVFLKKRKEASSYETKNSVLYH